MGRLSPVHVKHAIQQIARIVTSFRNHVLNCHWGQLTAARRGALVVLSTVSRYIAAAAALTIGVSACSSGGSEDVLRVYSGRHYDLEQAFVQFSEQTGISIEFLTGTDAELRERIQAEGKETQADLYLTVDASNLVTASEAGMFAPLTSSILDEAVPQSLRGSNNEWFGLTMRARTIVYHPDHVSPSEIPSTYEELADPKWEGRLCLRNSSNVYTQSLVASLIANIGRPAALDVVSGWADNAEILNNDVLILESIADGLCDVGIANHYYLARMIEEDPEFPVKLSWVDQDGRGVHVNISGGGVTRHADDPDLAQQLLEWLATDGQSVFVDNNHEYPVNPDVAPEPLISEHFGTDFVRDNLDAGSFGALNADAVRLMDEAGYR